MQQITSKTKSRERLFSLFDKKDRWQASGLLALMVLGAGLEMIAVSLMFPLIDTIARTDPTPSTKFGEILNRLLPNASHGEVALTLLTIIVSFYVVKNLFFVALIFLQWRFGFAMQGKLSTMLFDCYLRLPYTFHLQHNTADLLRNLTQETDFVVWGLIFPALTFITETLIAIGLTALLFSTQPFSAIVISGIFGSIGFSYYWIFHKRMINWTQLRMKHDSKRIRAIQEGLGGLKELKVLGRTSYFIEEYKNHNRARGNALSKQEVVHSSNLLLLEVLGISSLLVLSGVAFMQHDSLVTTLPLMGIFAAAAFRLIPATNRISINFQKLKSGAPVIETLATALDEAEKASIQFGLNVSTSTESIELPFRHDITLENITYTYPNRTKSALQNTSLKINKGEVVCVVGPSGIGKTTLIDILLGIFPPQYGRVLVDGINIQDHLSAWQRKIGYIPQTNYMIDGTIRDNVGLGISSDQIDDKLVTSALKDAQLETLVAALPKGIYTPIGELGRQLSGGQRQRIGIARALYHNPEVLVLDEATASLDHDTESRIVDLIRNIRKNQTVILITHRTETLACCTKIFDLSK